MSQNFVINGVTYPYPDVGESEWSQPLIDWSNAVTNGMLQKSGGAFTLTAEVDFGGSFGIKSLYYKSRTSNPASAGQIRLARADVISWRNEANGADLPLGVDSSNRITFNSVLLLTAAGGTMTGALLGDVGSAGAPGFAFAGRTNQGMWSPSSSAIAFSAGGSELMRLVSGVGMGVGGTPSDARLLVASGTMRKGLWITGTPTAASASAFGAYVDVTLTAAANSDQLYGLRVGATASVGSFTGTAAYGLYVDAVTGAATNYGAFISGWVGLGTNAPDAPLKVFYNGVHSRFSSWNWRGHGLSRAPMLVLTTEDAAGNDIGTCIAFYQNTNGSGTDIQHGVLAFSQNGADTTKAKFEMYLRAGDDSIQVMQVRGLATAGYSHTLFGPPTMTPGCTVHIEADSGDVDSGLRLERFSSTAARYNFIINSSGNLIVRNTDDTTPGILMKTNGAVSIHGTETNDSASAGDVGEYVESNDTSFGNVAATTEYGDITSISLTAGDWDVTGAVVVTANGATVAAQHAAVSVNSGNTTSDHVEGVNQVPARPTVLGADVTMVVANYRLSLSGTTTVYLKTRCDYTVATPQAKGSIRARRRR